MRKKKKNLSEFFLITNSLLHEIFFFSFLTMIENENFSLFGFKSSRNNFKRGCVVINEKSEGLTFFPLHLSAKNWIGNAYEEN